MPGDIVERYPMSNIAYQYRFRSGTDLMPLLIFFFFFLLLLVLVGVMATVFKESLRLRRFKSDRGEIWQDCY